MKHPISFGFYYICTYAVGGQRLTLSSIGAVPLLQDIFRKRYAYYL